MRLGPSAKNPEALKEGGDWSALTALYSAKVLERAPANHAEALNRSAAASERHARGLKLATWALVAVTVALVLLTVLVPLF